MPVCSYGRTGQGGRLGRRGLPYLLFQVLLPVPAPLVDLAAVFGLFTEQWQVVPGYWLALQAIPSVIAFRLDREPLKPLLVLALRQFVYRQQSVVTAPAGAQRRGIAR